MKFCPITNTYLLPTTIISYRSPQKHSSIFVKVEDLLEEDDFEKLIRIYNNIFLSVTAYDTYDLKMADSFGQIHDKIYGRITDLKTKKIERVRKKIKKIEKKSTGWKATFLSFITLGIRPLILLIKVNQKESKIEQINNKTYEIYSKFTLSLRQMKNRAAVKIKHPKTEALQKLEEHRLSDDEEELLRLKSVPRIERSLKKVTEEKKLSNRHQIALGRSLELREQLKDSHYVVNHGQNLDLMLVNMIARKLNEEFESHQYKSFECLRHDTSVRDALDNDFIFKLLKDEKADDWDFRNELISGDCVLESTRRSESAIYFFGGNKNVAAVHNPTLLYDLILKIAQDYISDQKVASRLSDNLVRLSKGFPTGGNLYSICIPKEKFGESCFFSKPYGTPLENQDHLKTQIEKMQSGEYSGECPQIRVYSNKVRVKDGYHVILNSTLKDDQLLKIEDEVSLCIQAALTGYRIQKTTNKMVFE